MAFQVAEYKGVAHPFDHTTKMAGRHWLAGFLARNRTLSIREPEATSINRAVGFNKAQVDNCFEIWRSLLESFGPLDDDRIWNMDESGLTVVHKPGRIVAKKVRNRLESDEWRKGENGHYHMRHECKWALSCTIYNLPEEENERALARWLSTWYSGSGDRQ